MYIKYTFKVKKALFSAVNSGHIRQVTEELVHFKNFQVV